MKNKIIFIVLLFSFFSFKPVEAFSFAELNRQIQAIYEKIQQLKLSFANLGPRINAQSYLVASISDNSVILEKNINNPHTIASITKLMNAVVAFENIDTEKKITLTEEMLKPLGYSPSLFKGLNVSAQNLLKASLIQSTNDASQSLTYFLKDKNFLELMNQKAKELGMANTCFYDVHGLNPSNKSTASDLLKLLKYIYANHPEILDITKNNDFWLPNQTGRLLKFANLNSFYNLSEFIGGKSGYLPEAKETFASLFNVNGKPIAVILLYSDNKKTDTLEILEWLKKNN